MKFLRDLKDFITNVASDERIPDRDKKIILAMVALLVSPFDIIPDWIPIFGMLDDVIIVSTINNISVATHLQISARPVIALIIVSAHTRSYISSPW